MEARRRGACGRAGFCHHAAGLVREHAAAALLPTDIVARVTWSNGTVVDASTLARLAISGAPPGKSFAEAHADQLPTFKACFFGGISEGANMA